MPRDYWIAGLGKDIKNKLTGTKSYSITYVPKTSQPQLEEIFKQPKIYEDGSNKQFTDVKTVNHSVQNGPLDVSKTRQYEYKSLETLAKNVDLINLNPETIPAAKQVKVHATSFDKTASDEIYTPEYVMITDSLREKIEKFPGICSIPFFVRLNRKSSNLLANPSSAFVVIPYQAQKGNILWKTIGSQLIKLGEHCHQINKQNFASLFQSAVQVYRPDCRNWSNFQMLDRPDLKRLLVDTLPFIVDQALSLPNLVENSIPNLLSNESRTIYLTRKLCCSLLANAFFCTFPEPKIDQMPDFNFFRLYNDTQSQRCEVKKEKIKCLLQYFQIMEKYEDEKTFQNQIVSFERRCVTKKVNWLHENQTLCEVSVEANKKIEEAANMLQVDFANKVVGGGVLNDGSVMEEIRFCVSPELLVSRLFTQTLNDNEVLVVTGTEIFSRYSGYSTSFMCEGPSNYDFGKHFTDNFGRTFTQVVAMDACSFRRNETAAQFQPKLIDRELHKANAAFIHGKAGISPVATGNWGCGAFNGNQELKFLIQWMAASHQGRPSMLYHTIGDKMQAQYITDISVTLRQKSVTVGELYKSISQFSFKIGNQHVQTGSLFKFVKQYFSN